MALALQPLRPFRHFPSQIGHNGRKIDPPPFFFPPTLFRNAAQKIRDRFLAAVSCRAFPPLPTFFRGCHFMQDASDQENRRKFLPNRGFETKASSLFFPICWCLSNRARNEQPRCVVFSLFPFLLWYLENVSLP